MSDQTVERRRNPRLVREERLLMQVTAIDDAPPPERMTSACRTVDISAGGLRLRLNEPVQAGSRIDLWVEVTGRSGKLLLSGEVRWSVQQDEGHLIGIQLHERDGFDLLAWKALFGG